MSDSVVVLAGWFLLGLLGFTECFKSNLLGTSSLLSGQAALKWSPWLFFSSEVFFPSLTTMYGSSDSFHQEYSGFSIIRTPIIRTLNYPNAWTLPCFRQQREKDVPVTGVLLQEKAKLLYERLFPDATTPFSASMEFRSRFTTSELAERSHERCSTLYYSVAN